MKGGLKNSEKITSHPKTKIELAEKYQYLVAKIADKKYKDVSEFRENLEEVGYIGLLNAANLYDKSVHKMDFETYAQIMITEEMYQYLVNHNRQVNCPNWLAQLNQEINRFVIRYREQYQRFPQISEIADQLNVNSLGLREILKSRDSLWGIHYSHKINKYMNLSQIQPKLEKIKSQSYQSFLLSIEDLITLRRAFKQLKALQESIVYCLFVMDLGQTKMAKMLGLSPQKVNKMKKKALTNLE